MSVPKKYFATMGLIWVGCGVVFIFVNTLLLAPQKRQRQQIENQLDQIKQTYRSALKVAQEETQTRARQQIEQLREQLKDFVVDSEDSANVIFEISQIANDKNVGSFSIKTKDDRKSPELPDRKYIRESHIAVSFTGSFNQFATFLNALERHRPVIFIDQLKITRAKKHDSAHKVDMSLAVFVKKQQES